MLIDYFLVSLMQNIMFFHSPDVGEFVHVHVLLGRVLSRTDSEFMLELHNTENGLHMLPVSIEKNMTSLLEQTRCFNIFFLREIHLRPKG